MKWLNLTSGLLLFLFIGVKVCANPTTDSEARTALRYVDSPSAWPFSYNRNNKLSGIFPQLLETISDDLQIDITTQMAPDIRTLDQIHIQNADITSIATYQSSISPNLNLQDYPDFFNTCETPIITGVMSIISSKPIPNLEKSNSITLTIGTIRLSDSDNILKKPYNDQYKIIIFNTADLMIKSFIARRIDSIVGDKSINMALLDKFSSNSISLYEQPIGNYQVHLATGKHVDKIHKNEICKLLSAYKINGTIHDIKEKILKGT